MFTQKHQPTQFSDLVFQNEIARARLEAYASGKKKGNLLLWGPYGTAKSTTAKIIAETSRDVEATLFGIDVDVVNSARFRENATKPMSFDRIERGWNISGHTYPYAVLDEFDILSQAKQDVVREIMDRNLGRAGFILTTNHLHRIDGAIQSRCDVVELPKLEPDVLVGASQKILKAEGVLIPDGAVLQLVEDSKGDWRKLLRYLEAVVDGDRATTAAKITNSM